MAYLNLAAPIRSEKVRDFQPPWRTVFVYLCRECGNETKVRAGSFRGKRAVPGVGAIHCPHCETIEESERRIEAGQARWSETGSTK